MKDWVYKKTKRLGTLKIEYLLCFILINLMSVSCGNSTKRNNASNETKVVATLVQNKDIDEFIEEKIDIPIAVNLSNFREEWHDTYLGFKVKEEDDKAMFIDATSPYYDGYVSGHRFETHEPAWVEKIGYMEYLMLDLDMVNNTSERLDIQELDIKVESSKLDSLPYVYVVTETSKCNTISFYNASWFNWKGFTFFYSILKNGENFDGSYKLKRHIDYFDNYITIDLLHDLITVGYDFERMCRIVYGDNFDFNEYTKRYNTTTIKDNFGIGTDYETLCFISENPEEFHPFDAEVYDDYENSKTYRGVAKLYGKIRFDLNGEEFSFKSKISLSDGCEYGAGSNLDDKFNVALKTTDIDYELRYPYTTVIEPYGAERVSLIIKAEKSSNHVFYITMKNGNGLNIRSKDIHIHYMSPRNYLVDNGTD